MVGEKVLLDGERLELNWSVNFRAARYFGSKTYFKFQLNLDF